MATASSEHLETLARRVADALPAAVVEEVVLTGSVSRGVADDASDVEMLVVVSEPLELEDCFGLARAAGLEELGTWGGQGGPARRVSGRRESVPVELIWWPRAYADAQIDRLLAGELPTTADALAHGVPLRTTGLLAAWQDRLGAYPPELAAAQIEQAALPWGGFAPAGVLTLVRPGDRLALVEWMLDGALRVLTIVFALNGVWRPTTKRLAARIAPLAIKPDRLAERIDEALTEPDPRRALLVMSELQLDAVRLAPSGPNVDRARSWLAAAADVLRREPPGAATPSLQALLDAFNAHDVDAVLSFFTDDCVFDMPRGPAPGGRRLTGTQQVREGIRSRFDGIPDIHYGDDRHWTCGDRGVSEWTIRGTQATGERIEVRGCDLFEFSDGRISRKDSFWKIVD